MVGCIKFERMALCSHSTLQFKCTLQNSVLPSNKKDVHVTRLHGAVLLLKVKLYRSLIEHEVIEMESGILWPAEKSSSF
jgi:hypothetical protein